MPVGCRRLEKRRSRAAPLVTAQDRTVSPVRASVSRMGPSRSSLEPRRRATRPSGLTSAKYEVSSVDHVLGRSATSYAVSGGGVDRAPVRAERQALGLGDRAHEFRWQVRRPQVPDQHEGWVDELGLAIGSGRCMAAARYRPSALKSMSVRMRAPARHLEGGPVLGHCVRIQQPDRLGRPWSSCRRRGTRRVG